MVLLALGCNDVEPPLLEQIGLELREEDAPVWFDVRLDLAHGYQTSSTEQTGRWHPVEVRGPEFTVELVADPAQGTPCTERDVMFRFPLTDGWQQVCQALHGVYVERYVRSGGRLLRCSVNVGPSPELRAEAWGGCQSMRVTRIAPTTAPMREQRLVMRDEKQTIVIEVSVRVPERFDMHSHRVDEVSFRRASQDPSFELYLDRHVQHHLEPDGACTDGGVVERALRSSDGLMELCRWTHERDELRVIHRFVHHEGHIVTCKALGPSPAAVEDSWKVCESLRVSTRLN